MRPIYLKVKAFGPFINEEVVDFDKLSTQGLFLITGPTGSGKTSIFDAITYALYGKASGEKKQEDSLRNDLASDKDETYCELTFELRGKHYVVTRIPSYQKSNNKTKTPAKAKLVMPDGAIIEGPKDVTNKIQELLGLEVNQFKQIAMIAQGEFTKLLFASSDDKEKIFRKIFNTFKYESFEKTLKDKCSSLSKDLTSGKTAIKAHKQNIDIDDNENIDIYLENLKAYIDSLEEDYKKHEEKIKAMQKEYDLMNNTLNQMEKENTDIINLNTLTKQLNEHLVKQNEINELEVYKTKLQEASSIVSKEETYTTAIRSLNNTKSNLEKATKDKQTIQEAYDKAYEQYQQLGQYQAKQDELNKEYQNISILADELQDVESARIKKIQAKNKLQEVEANKASYKNTIDTYTAKVEEYQKKIIEDTIEINKAESYKESANKIKAKIAKYKEVKEADKKFEQNKIIYNQKVEMFNQVKAELEIFNQEVIHEENTFLSMQAGILANELKENEPCPVCGSIHHPSPAKLINTNITKEYIDKQKVKLKAMEEKRNQIYNELIQDKSNLDMMKDDINKTIELYELKDVSYEELVSQYNDLAKAYNNTVALDKSVKQLENECKSLNGQKENLNKLLEQCDSERENYNKEISGYEAIINKKEYTMTYQEANRIKNQLKIDIANNDKTIKSIQAQYDQLSKEYTVITTNIKTYTEQLEATQVEVNNSYALFEQEVSKIGGFNAYNAMKNDFTKIKQYESHIKNYNDTVIDLKARISHYDASLKEKVLHDLDAYSEVVEMKKAEIDALNKTNKDLYSKLDSHKKAYKNIYATYKTIEKIDKEYAIYNELYAVTSGDNNQKVSFERFILSAYFEQIITYANARFTQMTGHRFKLVRKLEKSKGRTQSGLDLQVRDYQSGTIRDVNTLSGGESFKAALSLALGLSEMIQSNAGGIELNTLFIDEGFGTLDQESLDQAIKVLMELKQENKMIGIISHVTELKQRIDNQLVVEKTSKGSKISN